MSEDKGFYSPEAKSNTDKGPKNKAEKKTQSASQLGALEVNGGEPRLTADASISPESSDAETLRADIERIRKLRKPFGSMTQKLAYPPRPGYHRHWFSDEPGRIDEATANGWAHVTGKDGQPIKRVVGRGRDSGALHGYLMELPEIFWTEDMAYRHADAQARVDEIKKAPFRAKPGQADRSDAGKFYSPSDEVLAIHKR